MFEEINEQVDVLVSFKREHNQVKVLPHTVNWRGKHYKLDTMGLHHPALRGREYIHIFEFATSSIKFTLELHTNTLEWILAEVYYDYSS
jgi:hypothetical protein